MEDNERLRTGRLFEEPIAQLYAEREKVALEGDGMQTIFHHTLPVIIHIHTPVSATIQRNPNLARVITGRKLSFLLTRRPHPLPSWRHHEGETNDRR